MQVCEGLSGHYCLDGVGMTGVGKDFGSRQHEVQLPALPHPGPAFRESNFTALSVVISQGNISGDKTDNNGHYLKGLLYGPNMSKAF